MNQANIKIVMGGKSLSDGKYQVYLRITKDRRKKEIALGIRGSRDDFLGEQFTKKHHNHKIDNQLIFIQKQRAYEIIRKFQVDEVNFTLEEFVDKFRGKGEFKDNVMDFFEEIIGEMVSSGRIGNARAYSEAHQSLKRFMKAKSYRIVKFKDLNPEALEKFEVYMRSRGNENGGIALKMRQIRALFNKAISRKIIGQEIYPFKFYKISKLKLKPNKRALTIDEFKKIRDVDLSEHPLLLEAYHYFMFSFYTRGMNFVDIMLLKKKDIVNNRIYYTRSKTKGKFSIEIVEKAQDIIDFYKNKTANSLYVFPILLSDNMTPQQIEYRKAKVLGRYNRKLKELAELAGVEKVLTSYVARHSFATILKQIGTSKDVISELMGHSDVQITKTYLKEFDSDELDDANRKLLNL